MKYLPSHFKVHIYLQHVEVKPHEWRAIWNATAPQAKRKRSPR